MISWSRLAMARSDPFISPIFDRRSLSPSALSFFQRASAFSSWARSFIAARSSSENPLDDLPLAGFFGASLAVVLADFFVPFFGLMEEPPHTKGWKLRRSPNGMGSEVLRRSSGSHYSPGARYRT